MKIFFIILIAVIISHNLKAETIIYAHTLSYHLNRDGNFNEKNYGIGMRNYNNDKEKSYHYITLGSYKNSEYVKSNYIGTGWEWNVSENIKLGLVTGVITGYSLGKLLPYIVPTIRYKRMTIVVSPYPEPVYHLTVDVIKF